MDPNNSNTPPGAPPSAPSLSIDEWVDSVSPDNTAGERAMCRRLARAEQWDGASMAPKIRETIQALRGGSGAQGGARDAGGRYAAPSAPVAAAPPLPPAFNTGPPAPSSSTPGVGLLPADPAMWPQDTIRRMAPREFMAAWNAYLDGSGRAWSPYKSLVGSRAHEKTADLANALSDARRGR